MENFVFVMEIKSHFILIKETPKFALPVSICVTLRDAFVSCTQVPCDAGVTMETTLLNGKIRLQNCFILITFSFSVCSKRSSLLNMEWTWNITNLWAEGWYTCTTFQSLPTFFSNKFLLFLLLCVWKRQVTDKACMYFVLSAYSQKIL